MIRYNGKFGKNGRRNRGNMIGNNGNTKRLFNKRCPYGRDCKYGINCKDYHLISELNWFRKNGYGNINGKGFRKDGNGNGNHNRNRNREMDIIGWYQVMIIRWLYDKQNSEMV